jgi:hypothetical protein
MLVAVCLCSIAAFGQVASIIPATNRIDWIPGVTIGVFGGIPTNRSVFTTLPAGATVAQINQAITACPAGQIVKLSPGAYTIDGSITLKSRVTLQGAKKPTSREGSSVLLMSSSSSIRCIGEGTVSNPSDRVHSGYTKGSTNLNLLPGGPLVSAGQYLLLSQDNDPNVVQIFSGATNHMTVDHVRVISVTNGTNVNFWPPLVSSFQAAFTPRYRIKSGRYIEYAGLEDVYIVPDKTVQTPIARAHAFSCWTKNVVLTNVVNNGNYEFGSLQCEQRHVDVFKSVSSGDGYGVECDVESVTWSGCRGLWIEDCIGDGLYHSIITSGLVGSVVSYCLSTNEHAPTGITYPTGSYNAAHSAGGRMDLWEGNWGSSYFTTDRIHGNTTHQVLWRNRFAGAANAVFSTNAHMPMIWLGKGSYWYYAVGNVLGGEWSYSDPNRYVYEYTAQSWDSASGTHNGAMYMLGYATYQQPADSKVINTFVRYLNYNFFHRSATTEASIAGAPTIDDSLIYTSKPAFFAHLKWPPIDKGNPNVAPDAIPAGYRYIHGVDPVDAVRSPSALRPVP